MVDTTIKYVEILSAKLHPQRVLASLVARDDLIHNLNFHQVAAGDAQKERSPSLHPKLAILTAPAGYGKSTLLYQLKQSREQHQEVVCWLSLDANDNTLNSFSTYLIKSYNEAISSIDQSENSETLATYPNANSKERISLLFNKIENHKEPVTFILDDFERLKNPPLFDFVDWMLESMPNKISLVIGCRTTPAIRSIPILKASGQLAEINMGKLQFTREETASYFIQSGIDYLSNSAINSLYKKTEGWIAALQLVMLAIREQSDPEAFIDEFSGNDRDIVQYLGNSVFGKLDDHTKQFLMRTSILERMNAELCALVTDQVDAITTIANQERAGMFIFSLDRQNTWYRYHHLFRELLLTQFIQAEPKLYHELCKRAARWYEQQNSIIDAIGYYLKAEEYTLATELIADRAINLVQYQGQHETLFGWLRELPERYIYSSPKILVCYLWSLIFTRQLSKVDQLLASDAVTHPGKGAQNTSVREDIKTDYIHSNAEMIKGLRCTLSGNQILAREQSATWLEKWTTPSLFDHGTMLGNLAAACLHTLEFEKGRNSLIEASNDFHRCGAGYGIAWMDCIHSTIYMRQGLFKEAHKLLEQAQLRSNQNMGQHSFTSAMLSLSLGKVYYELNEINKSERMIEKGFLYIEDHGLPDTSLDGFVTRARILVRQDQLNQALDVLSAGERFGREKHIANFEAMVVLERCRLLLANDNAALAKTLFSDHCLHLTEKESQSVTPYEQILIETVKAQLLIIDHCNKQALDLLKPVIIQCQNNGVDSQLVILNMLKAHALANSGEAAKALRAFEQALIKAQEQSAIAVIVDNRHLVESLLPTLISSRSFGESDKLRNFAELLCGILKITHTLEPSDKTEPLDVKKIKESLTKRELEILGFLEQGLTNNELADALFVSVATIKWHLSNIYTKLGTKNKIQTIKVAKDYLN